MTAPVLSVSPSRSNTLTRRGHPHMTDVTVALQVPIKNIFAIGASMDRTSETI